MKLKLAISNYRSIDVPIRFLLRKMYFSEAIIVLLILAISAPMSHAEIESISAETLRQGNGQSYWQVEVTCQGESDSIAIRQLGAESNWCTNSDPIETCESSKEILADKICNTALLSILRPSKKPSISVASYQANKAQLTTQSKAQLTAQSKAQLTAQSERQRQEKNKRETEFRQLDQEQASLKLERNKLNKEKVDLLDLEFDLARQLKEIEEKKVQLEKL